MKLKSIAYVGILVGALAFASFANNPQQIIDISFQGNWAKITCLEGSQYYQYCINYDMPSYNEIISAASLAIVTGYSVRIYFEQCSGYCNFGYQCDKKILSLQFGHF